MFTKGIHADLKAALEAIGTAVGLFELDQGGAYRLVSGNTLFGQSFFLTVDSALGKAIHEVFPRYVAKELEGPMERCMLQQVPMELELAMDSEGRTAWWRVLLTPIIAKHTRVSRILMTAIDITEKKQLETALEHSRKRFIAVVNSAYDGIISVSSDQRIELMNNAAMEMFAVDEKVLGTKLEGLLPHRFRTHHDEYITGFKASPVASRPMHARASVVGLRADGTEFPVEVTIAKIRVGEAMEMTAVLRDISERARLIEELKVAATIDPLTGIANRRRIDEAMRSEFLRCKRFGRMMSVLMVDIDHFKHVNDEFGHGAGDLALKSIVTRMVPLLREIDVLGRWGGEEFIVLLPETGLEPATVCAQRILDETRGAPHQISPDRAIPLTVSVGVASILEHEEDLEPLLLRVDTALYRAKNEGRNRLEVARD